ncbi:MAG: lysylphosphatidylglycerol synthase transmembrane domain-containing protein [Candidatus Micrarchaeota archaeon]
MKLKNLLWPAVSLAMLAALFCVSDMKVVFSANLLYASASIACFMASIFFWGAAWHIVLKKDFLSEQRVNFKSMIGIFAPMGLGGDLLRAHFAQSEKIGRAEALSASFVVKFFKFAVMLFYLVFAVVLLARKSADYSLYEPAFIGAFLLIIFAIIIIALFNYPRFASVLQRIFRRVNVMHLHKNIKMHFKSLSSGASVSIILILVVSTVLEMGAVYFAAKAVGIPLLVAHVFILGAVVNMLALAAFTPQGIGFVEAGAAVVMSMGFFAVSPPLIAGFLVIWNIVRIWVPSAAAAALISIDSFRGHEK